MRASTRKSQQNNQVRVYDEKKNFAEQSDGGLSRAKRRGGEILERLNIDLKARGETLTLDQIIEISDLLSK